MTSLPRKTTFYEWFNTTLDNSWLEFKAFISSSISPSYSFYNLISEYADCMLPFTKDSNEKISVYPSIRLDQTERKYSKEYYNAFIKNTDDIRLYYICQSSNGESYAALIDYPYGKTRKRKVGFIPLDYLIRMKTDDEPESLITDHSISCYNIPDHGDPTQLNPGFTVYLLTNSEEWQQIMYYNIDNWHIKWVKTAQLF